VPLLDHFRPPLSRTHPWRAFHGAWAAAIARLLNRGVLPPGYYAVPFVDRDGPVEIDVAALADAEAPDDPGPAAWQPAAPAVAVAIDPAIDESVRVEVRTDDGDPRLVAAVELVSPRNKDRPAARRAFAAKCAGYLTRGAGLVVVDAVTTRRADLHKGILKALGAGGTVGPAGPSAVAYRVAGAELAAWPAPLAVGRPLPTLPLWIAPDLPIPLDLDAGHAAACDDVRVRPAG
jgi:hypothetical protein